MSAVSDTFIASKNARCVPFTTTLSFHSVSRCNRIVSSTTSLSGGVTTSTRFPSLGDALDQHRRYRIEGVCAVAEEVDQGRLLLAGRFVKFDSWMVLAFDERTIR